MSNIDSYKNKFLIIIAGPTAVGKSGIAIQLAKFYNAEVFSADSRQIYKEMSIGTAKPSAKELETVKHHFIDHISIHQPYSVGQYESEIKIALFDYFKSNNIAIVCGGTGLYIRALMEGLDDFPDISYAVTQHYQNIYDNYGLGLLQKELEIKDPIYYQNVDKSNHRRIMRALCVIEASGKPYSSLLSIKDGSKLPFQMIPILLDLSRDKLYERINNRVDIMMKEGLETEAYLLHQLKGLRALETVGYQELFDYFEHKTDLKTAITLIKQNSRRYAKRQMTWFRKYGNWQVFNIYDISELQDFISGIISIAKK